MKHEVFSVEFERRLFALRDVINDYERSRNVCNVLPFLSVCSRYCWCNNPIILVNDRVFRSRLPKTPDVNHLLDNLGDIKDIYNTDDILF